MLRDLSGRRHHVTTAVTLRSREKTLTRTDTTQVWFKPLSEEEICYYVDRFQPYDKAGAYAIQEWIGYAGITRIDGSYFNVVGFPVHCVYEMLQQFI
jgi:septum formation protein